MSAAITISATQMPKLKSLKNIQNGCVPIALQYLSKATIETMISAIIFPGMDEEDTKLAGKMLGLTLKKVEFSPMELRKFIKQFPEGSYLLFTFDHALVLEDGKIVDPQCKKSPGLRRVIKSAWRVYK
jgi:hypothetical protein